MRSAPASERSGAPGTSQGVSPMQLASLIAASRLIAEQDAMAVIGNNIANADTPAYQAERV
ncbi:MAG: flagellar basal body protein, partial [Acetobacteraceae bacterium]